MPCSPPKIYHVSLDISKIEEACIYPEALKHEETRAGARWPVFCSWNSAHCYGHKGNGIDPFVLLFCFVLFWLS